MSQVIDEEMYVQSVREFVAELQKIHQERQFDAIVSPKRSGLFLGVWASHALSLPMFTPAELRSVPAKFKNILIVDTAVCKGKTLQKIRNQLKPRLTFTAVIWREGDGQCDFVLKPENIGLISFFYESPVA